MKTRLIVLDIDGVIFNIKSSWREFHKKLGTYDFDRLEKLRNDYLNGKISYLDWANEEVKVWKGREYSTFEKICYEFPFVKNAVKTIRELKKRNYFLIALSVGGLWKPINKRLKKIGIDAVFCNDLEEVNGILTGKFVLRVEHDKKHEIIERVLKEKGVKWEECAAIGDDLTNREVFRRAGFSIAFCSNDEELKRIAKVVVEEKDLAKILPYF